MVKLKELCALVKICNDYGEPELGRSFSHLRGIALGRYYTDFTYECKQILDSCDSKKNSKEFLAALSSIINNYPTDVDYRKIVNACNSKTSNSKTLAKALYAEWSSLGKEDKHLIGIYKEMFISNLSRYELEVLTCKQLVMDKEGKDTLTDCYHKTAVDLLLENNSDSENLVDVDTIFNSYKFKLNISEDAWDAEIIRLTELCGSDNPKDIAAFIQDILM